MKKTPQNKKQRSFLVQGSRKRHLKLPHGWISRNTGWPDAASVLHHRPCPRILRRPPFAGPESPISTPPSLIALFVAFARMSLAGFGGVLVFARRAIVEQHRWMTADEFNETFALCHFLPGAQYRQPDDGVRLAVSRHCRRHRRLCRAIGAAARDHDHPGDALCTVWRVSKRSGGFLAGVSCAAVGLLLSVVLRMMGPLIKRRDAAGLIILLAVFVRDRDRAAAVARGAAGGDPDQHSHHRHDAPADGRMNDSNPILTLAWTFGVMSLCCGRRRQFGDPGNAPRRGRRSPLVERQAIRRRGLQSRSFRRGRMC